MELGYKLVYVDDQFSTSFKPSFGQEAVNKFIINIVKVSNFYSSLMKKHFNKNFESSTKCWICGNTFTGGDHTVRDPSHGTGKYRVLHTQIVISPSV